MSTTSLRVLLIGKGGRESALAWKLSQSHRVEKIFVVPGNGGTENVDKVTNIDAKVDDYPSLAEMAKEPLIWLYLAQASSLTASREIFVQLRYHVLRHLTKRHK